MKEKRKYNILRGTSDDSSWCRANKECRAILRGASGDIPCIRTDLERNDTMSGILATGQARDVVLFCEGLLVTSTGTGRTKDVVALYGRDFWR